ncbi:HET-domain-containing protein [Cenococcum geophilum 1.58]|uniref:HET-domain-containing protein n=1 Tax=Cenococcum geophilum 1.58 TaxID=794803 RepID=UPI00358EF41F|nr:HET-domain-containing protein [Cenococcum geophilum 1.58]
MFYNVLLTAGFFDLLNMAQRDITGLGDIISGSDLYSWEPFKGCNGCEGLCSVLKSASSIRQLLQDQKIYVFKGPFGLLKSFAQRGCSFAKHLADLHGTSGENEDVVEFSFQRSSRDQEGLGLISLLDSKSTVQYLALATVQDDPAGNVVKNRPVTANPVSPPNILKFALWQHFCVTGAYGHDQCAVATQEQTELPTRVIAVGSDTVAPRLCLSQGQIGKYATLSYCWGGQQPHQTTTARLQEYTQALPFEQLPASIRDAIFLARALLIPYLWIDSLCIIQDSTEDKSREIAQMARIFKNSYTTFAAARANSCHEGFLGVQEETASRLKACFKLPMNSLDGTTGTVMIYPNRFQEVDERFGKVPIDSRAWTYQELLLSPRVLSFYHDGVEWKCPSMLTSDDGLKDEELIHFAPMFLRKYELTPLFFSGLDPETLSDDAEELAELPSLWWSVVYAYSAGDITVLDDKLPALSAVAFEFQHLRQDTYLAGLWRSTLVTDLQWFYIHKIENSSVEKIERNPSYRIPTWSWASIDGARILGPEDSETQRPSERVDVLFCETYLVSPAAPFGLVYGGRLTIRGPLKSLTIKDAWKHFGSGPDSWDEPKTIGRLHTDFRGRGDLVDYQSFQFELGIPPGETVIWFLGLSRKSPEEDESCGLALLKHRNGLFSRAGLFRLGLKHVTPTPSALQCHLMDHWGDDYVATTITII